VFPAEKARRPFFGGSKSGPGGNIKNRHLPALRTNTSAVSVLNAPHHVFIRGMKNIVCCPDDPAPG
jgi:hypothetical protein